LCNEELHGEGVIPLKDNVESSTCDFGFNSMNKERNENDTGKGDEEA
jgi:hypothetical protein